MLLDLKDEGLNTKPLQLYHGSKSGIHGRIEPSSRELCDFGSGFYTGTLKEQAFALVCRPQHASRKFYSIELNTHGLNVCKLDGMQWLFFVLYHRGELRKYNGSALCDSICRFRKQADVICGMIADDKMSQAIDDFSVGRLSDVGLFYALSSVSLGLQYVMATQKACDQLRCREVQVGTEEFNRLRAFDKSYRESGRKAFEHASKAFRREGRFIDEILEEGVLSREFITLSSSWQ